MSETVARGKADKKNTTTIKIDDRVTSDVVVRLRTNEGRDHWLYCHSEVLTKKSKYFADRLSDTWPTCQILDSRYCVEVYCDEPEFNYHVSTFRLFYIQEPHTWHNVRNALGILKVAISLGCPQMANACMEYIEAVPWEEADEEEILKTFPSLGPDYVKILARLQPVNKITVSGIFVSSIRFAMSSPPASMQEMKLSAQEQIEYVLTEDDDVPLVSSEDEDVRNEVRNSVNDLLTRFTSMIENQNKLQDLKTILCDISWVCQILSKMEMMKDIVLFWADRSATIAKLTEESPFEAKFKVVEVTSKVMEAIGFGNVILPATRRLDVVKIWLPYVQKAKPLIEQVNIDEEEVSSVKIDNEIWQGLEAAFITIILTLPSVNQADILSEWLRSEHVRYPDLTEAFELWCYRSKIARRRIALIEEMSHLKNP